MAKKKSTAKPARKAAKPLAKAALKKAKTAPGKKAAKPTPIKSKAIASKKKGKPTPVKSNASAAPKKPSPLAARNGTVRVAKKVVSKQAPKGVKKTSKATTGLHREPAPPTRSGKVGKKSIAPVSAIKVSTTKSVAGAKGKQVPPARKAHPPVAVVNERQLPTKPAPAKAPQAAVPAKPVSVESLPPIKKRPAKERVVMEFYLNSSPNALYELLSTPSGFSEWYCQDVDVRGDQYTFIWDGEQEATTLIGRKLGEVIRFRRNDDEDPESYYEFRVRIDAMTNEVCLVVTDHAWPHEVEETRNLWASQIETLGRVLGA